MFNILEDGVYSSVDRTIEDTRWEYKNWSYYLLWGIVIKDGMKRVDYVLNLHGQGVGLLYEDGDCGDILVAVVDVDRFELWLTDVLSKAVDYTEWAPSEKVRYHLPWDDAVVDIWDFCRWSAAYYVNCVSKGELKPEMKEQIDKKYQRVATPTEEMAGRITASIKNILMRFAQNLVVDAERKALNRQVEEGVEKAD